MRIFTKSSSSVSSFEGMLKGPFFETNPLPMWIFDCKSFQFLVVNNAAIRKYGYTKAEFMKMKASDVRPPEDMALFAEAASAVVDSEFQPEGKWRHKLRNGDIIHVEVHATRVQFKGREATLSIIHDFTEQKKVESSLRETLEKQEVIFEGSRDAIFISDAQSGFVSVNQAACELSGYSRSELLIMKIPDLHADADLSAYDAFHDIIMSGEPALTEALMLSKGGRKIPVEFNNQRIILAGIPYMHTIARDITARKRAEEDLKLYGLLFKNLFEMVLCVRSKDLRIIEANDTAVDVLGYTRDELLSMTILELRTSESAELIPQQFVGKISDEVTFETINRRKDGRTFHAEVKLKWLTFNGEEIILGIARDLTERKHAEAALNKSETKYRELVDSMPDGYYQSTSAGRFIEVNPAFCKMLGYSRDELLAMNIPQTLYFAPSERVGESRFTGFSPTAEVYRLKRKDGSETWFEDNARYIQDESGRIVYHEGICRDITDRRHAEKLLIESEERYRLLVDKSPDAIAVLSDGNYVYVNPAMVRLLHAETSAQLIGKSAYDFIHPDAKGVTLSRAKEMLETQKALPRLETKFIRLDGTVVDVELQSAPVTYLGKLSIQSVIRDVTARKKVEEQLHLQSVALNTAANGIVITDREGRIVWANTAFETLTGYTIAEALGKNPREISRSGKHDRGFYKSLWDTILSGKVWRGEIINRRKDGTLYTEDMTIAPVRDDHGGINHFVAIKQDISDRKMLQEQFLQSQKLESIGQLAGGVAHDYNNILGVVIGYTELLRMKFKGEYENEKPIEAILAAANRGADLTRQLLAFARKETISPKVININTSIESIEKMLRRIIGENIKLLFHHGEDIWNIKIDPSQLDQMLVNLAANSRDAIKDIGKIEIATMNVSVDENYVSTDVGLTIGNFVKLSFTDNGIGMDEDTVSKVFEPFFTTKEKGQGTGLGLSTVYGIVKQNKGHIRVTSERGKGTTFEIYLPASREEADITQAQPLEISVNGTETILVVEDQADILELTKASLEKYGFHVLTASESGEALRSCDTYDGTIHLLLTDVIMPEMSGRSLSKQVKLLRPDIKTLFMSGYTSNELGPEGILDEKVEFVQKPFTPAQIAKKVREVLGT